MANKHDNSVLIFNDRMWYNFMARRGTSPEEKGYIFCEEVDNKNLFAMVQVPENTGTSVEVCSSGLFIRALTDFTANNPNIHIASYHTHPINKPSLGDLETFVSVYDERYRNHVVIGPDEINVIRTFPNGRHIDLNASGLLKIVRFKEEKMDIYLKEGKKISMEFLKSLKRYS